ncbi:putative Peroxidasin-like protein [Hypsibius exemplaris]|uniref:Peroxidasin-like protein n=1 Tax=Hypsibius exemplaris TaxID=2072580 RepID=A0A9X6RK46_HYPEX|nr:putative Peroxidasin-like protein [Hypsibius exemplaris]
MIAEFQMSLAIFASSQLQERQKTLDAVWQTETRSTPSATEWLPILVGEALMKAKRLTVRKNGRFTGFDVTTDPTLTNEFAAAAFRVGHAMVSSSFSQMTADFGALEKIKLGDTFFRGNRVYDKGTVENVLRGLTGQSGKMVESSVTAELAGRLFNTPKKPERGFDLVSLNIQRGRDHGLPGYMKWRTQCKLTTANTFDELKDLKILPDDLVEKLTTLYESVEDIDLFPAGIAEIPEDGSMIGPTFSCIITEQFQRLRSGDRFWYENDNALPSRLTDGQLASIRQTTIASILCQSQSGIESVQKCVFEAISDTTPRVACSDISPLNLDPWIGI